jgi:hypothetical protein
VKEFAGITRTHSRNGMFVDFKEAHQVYDMHRPYKREKSMGRFQ